MSANGTGPTHPTPTHPKPRPKTTGGGGPWPTGPGPSSPSGPSGPGRPLSPAAVIAAYQCRYDAACELIRAIDDERTLASVNRVTVEDRLRLSSAVWAFNRASAAISAIRP